MPPGAAGAQRRAPLSRGGEAGYLIATMAILFLIVFVDLLGFGIVIPLLPFYAEHFGAGPAAARTRR